MTLEIVERKKTYRPRHRDHGHESRVRRSYEMVGPGGSGSPVAYVWETGQLVIKTREALETHEDVVMGPYEASAAQRRETIG
jgi:hypothetical protein